MKTRLRLSDSWIVYFLIASSNLPNAHAKLPDFVCQYVLSAKTWATRSADAKRFDQRLREYAAQGFANFVTAASFTENAKTSPFYLVKVEEFEYLSLAAKFSTAERRYFRRKLPARAKITIEGKKFLDVLELALMDPSAWSRAMAELVEARGSALAFESPLRMFKDSLPHELRQDLLRQFAHYSSLKRDGDEFPLGSPKRLADRYLKYIHRGDLLIKTAQLSGASVKDAYRAYWNSIQNVVHIERPLSPDFVWQLLEEIQAILDTSQSLTSRWPPEVFLYGSVPNARADISHSDLDIAVYDAPEATVDAIKDRLRARLDEALPGHRMVVSLNPVGFAFMLQNQSVVFHVRSWRIEMLVADPDDTEGLGKVLRHSISPARGVDFDK